MDYLWNADHLSRSKFSFEHLAYCSATFDWLLRYMMVHSIFVIKLREGRGIILVEPLNEIFYHLTRAHEPLLSIAIRFETLSGTIRLNCTTSSPRFVRLDQSKRRSLLAFRFHEATSEKPLNGKRKLCD